MLATLLLNDKVRSVSNVTNGYDTLIGNRKLLTMAIENKIKQFNKRHYPMFNIKQNIIEFKYKR